MEPVKHARFRFEDLARLLRCRADAVVPGDYVFCATNGVCCNFFDDGIRGYRGASVAADQSDEGFLFIAGPAIAVTLSRDFRGGSTSLKLNASDGYTHIITVKTNNAVRFVQLKPDMKVYVL